MRLRSEVNLELKPWKENTCGEGDFWTLTRRLLDMELRISHYIEDVAKKWSIDNGMIQWKVMK